MSDSRIELCCAASNAPTSPSGRGRASGEGEGEADVGVARRKPAATHPLPAATASDLPRCYDEVFVKSCRSTLLVVPGLLRKLLFERDWESQFRQPVRFGKAGSIRLGSD